MQAIHCPVLCDHMYVDGTPFLLSSVKRKMRRKKEEEERPLLSRVALHAHILKFTHPSTGDSLEFTSDLPKDMKAVVNQLKKLG